MSDEPTLIKHVREQTRFEKWIRNNLAQLELSIFFIVYGLWTFVEGTTATVTNTAVLFIMAGVAFLVFSLRRDKNPTLYAVTGALVFLASMGRLLALIPQLADFGAGVTTSNVLVSALIIWTHIAIQALIITWLSATEIIRGFGAMYDFLREESGKS